MVVSADDTRREFVPVDLPRDVLWGFTREGLYALRQYTHWMPHSKGLVGPFMAKYWSGLTFQVAMKLTTDAGVWVKRGSHFSGLDVIDDLAELHLLAGGGSRIVRLAPEERVDDERRHGGVGGMTVSLEGIDPNAPGGLRELARALLGRMSPMTTAAVTPDNDTSVRPSPNKKENERKNES
ncbi:MAG: hypothetical protein RLZ86_1050 [Actinomycetota bacterium]|jgi:hypothetical protein